MSNEEAQLVENNRLHKFIIAFDVLNAIAVISLTALLITAWKSSRIRRAPTWFLYIFSWDAYSVAYLLIIGRQWGSEPVWGLCLVQSTLIYATPVFVSTTIVIFVSQIYFDIQNALGSKILEPNTVKKLAIVPWIFLVSIIFEVSAIGFLSPSSVDRSPSGMFCRVNVALPSQITGALVLLSIFVVLPFGAMVAYTVHRNRERWKSLAGSKEFQSYDLLFRVGVFLMAPVIGIGLVITKFLPSVRNIGEVNLIYSIPPALVGIVSSSQKDILNVWMFWRSPATDVKSQDIEQTETLSSETTTLRVSVDHS